MISTRDLSLLPDVEGLKALLQSMAMLDAILSPEWQYRYYSFNAQWGEREMMGSMRDGQGDDVFAWFTPAGCFLKGFAHESPLAADGRAWTGLFERVPDVFAAGVKEPAFRPEETTFCLWRATSDAAWSRGHFPFPPGADPDGSAGLLSPLDGRPESYQTWAEAYYERPVDPAAVREIYRKAPLTAGLVTALNPDLSIEDLKEDLREIGYPAA